jgi:hypothetical protein
LGHVLVGRPHLVHQGRPDVPALRPAAPGSDRLHQSGLGHRHDDPGSGTGGWLAISNGTAGGATTTNGKQESLQLQYVDSRWRAGVAANFNGSSADGSREAFGIFGGLKTGPIAWLAEVDIDTDHSLPSGPGGGQKELATLLEANYSPARGHNIKVTYEYRDPDRELANDQETRWSFVYELTPIQFLQLRFGARLGDGIPQLPSEHLRLYFAELHGFF